MKLIPTLVLTGSVLFSAVAMGGNARAPMPPVCVDYYQAVNAAWLNSPSVPDDSELWTGLSDRSRSRLMSMLERESARFARPDQTNLRKLLDLYASYRDRDTIEQLGVTPLAPDLALIESLNAPGQLPDVLARLYQNGVAGPLMLVGGAEGARLALTPAMQAKRASDDKPIATYSEAALRPHVIRMFRLTGAADPVANAAAEAVVRMTRAVSQASTSRKAGFDFAAFQRQVGLRPDQRVEVGDEVVSKMADLMRYPMADWRHYLTWNLLLQRAPLLPQRFAQEQASFMQLHGRSSSVGDVKFNVLFAAMPGALHQFYYERVLPPGVVYRGGSIAQHVREALSARIATRQWLSEQSRRQAQTKLGEMKILLGKPDNWIDYSEVLIEPGALVANMRRVARFNLERQVGMVGQPWPLGHMTRSDWMIEAGLFYEAARNTVVISPVLLQSEMLSASGDPATDYGKFGGAVAHEMLHGFDVSGVKQGPGSRAAALLLPAEESYLQQMARRQLAHGKRYASARDYTGQERRRMDEDLADLGAAPVALDALRRGRAADASETERFFRAFAQMERAKTSDPDTDASQRYRVNGVLSNMPRFALHYGCPAGSPLVRDENERIRLW